jgi:hypothetical protein
MTGQSHREVKSRTISRVITLAVFGALLVLMFVLATQGSTLAFAEVAA